ncbi:MAG: winged helix-turn-helix transcriptional regulator [Anaerosolibacter sp.]|jgi:pseudouridine kinase|uniref:PfkB family carbohydrate kinase n=1 Tax=Anaerosolibacter sp. TaxID=1872527 RepID=UPI002624D4F5|nr:PfkB family carbohydrate kinase [Anaerosolibacter sp.]MDF2545497.1 winged helix-turn-helix transcriptional regulator [Anaerosolibacter sp.]
MTEREKEILDIIRRNPMISQQELADTLGITRSSAAVHITNLVKKGFIAGKGYVLKEADYVAVVGGANIDIQGFVSKPLILKDSNPGNVRISLGGVGRNIAENLVKLGIQTKLFSAVGDDVYGKKLMEESRSSGIDMDHCLMLKNASTSTYLSILDHDGDMAAAVSHMDIFDNFSVDFLKNHGPILNNAQLIVLDTNIPQASIEFLITHFKDCFFFLDTVSTSKALKVKEIIGAFHTIKPNKYEAEVLSGISIVSTLDAEKACDYFLNQGVQQVFISMGKDGICYGDHQHTRFLSVPEIHVVNATGAGDAFMAGLVFGFLQKYTLDQSARFATAASIFALSHKDTIHPMMSAKNVQNIMKELI